MEADPKGGATMPEKTPWKNCNRFSEKLAQKILQLGLNGQKLARKSAVSDSEISRIMNGKSLPGLENAIALARAVGVSLDYLADDSLDAEPSLPKESTNEVETVILGLVREIGPLKALNILQNTRTMGYEIAAIRLLESKPIVAPLNAGEQARPNVSPAPANGRTANSA
jgi:transcriptional regulator with XRE-family HTH domain